MAVDVHLESILGDEMDRKDVADDLVSCYFEIQSRRIGSLLLLCLSVYVIFQSIIFSYRIPSFEHRYFHPDERVSKVVSLTSCRASSSQDKNERELRKHVLSDLESFDVIVTTYNTLSFQK